MSKDNLVFFLKNEDNVEALIGNILKGGVCITYLPKGEEYNVIAVVKVNQNDGSWKNGLCYGKKSSPQEIYIRTFDQLEKFSIATTLSS